MQEVLTLKEASKYLRLHISTVYRMAQQHKIPASKIGGVWRFRKKRIEDWFEKTSGYEKT